jgi:pimeloyl-ACP methyl ester carboxylesterase
VGPSPPGRCDPDGAITVAEQGSLYVPGTWVEAAGTYDDQGPFLPFVDDGQRFAVGQMYVQYQVPEATLGNPVVLVHGGGQTGRTWESTPDGREGWATLLLRRGHPVYIVDLPGRGRSPMPTFNGPFGALTTVDGDRAFVESPASRIGDELAFDLFRVGEAPPEPYPGSQFPREGIEQLELGQVPWYLPLDDAQAVGESLAALLEEIGPSVVVTHSQSGLLGWYLPEHTADVAAMVAIEPGAFVFGSADVPEPEPLADGTLVPINVPTSDVAMSALTDVPTLVLYGDHVPETPDPVTARDYWRVNRAAADDFAGALRGAGADVELVDLPDLGITGNTHMLFSDRNNDEALGVVDEFLRERGLGAC